LEKGERVGKLILEKGAQVGFVWLEKGERDGMVRLEQRPVLFTWRKEAGKYDLDGKRRDGIVWLVERSSGRYSLAG
jgi:hypothetical protein